MLMLGLVSYNDFKTVSVYIHIGYAFISVHCNISQKTVTCADIGKKIFGRTPKNIKVKIRTLINKKEKKRKPNS